MREYWARRPRATRTNPHWRTPDQMWDEACRYFEWASTNPLQEERVASDRGRPAVVTVNRVRAFTLDGLCAYLGVNASVFLKYESRPAFAPVIERIRMVIRTQKFENAAAGMLNANLVARDLGLAEKQEHSGPDGDPVTIRVVAADDPGDH